MLEGYGVSHKILGNKGLSLPRNLKPASNLETEALKDPAYVICIFRGYLGSMVVNVPYRRGYVAQAGKWSSEL